MQKFHKIANDNESQLPIHDPSINLNVSSTKIGIVSKASLFVKMKCGNIFGNRKMNFENFLVMILLSALLI